jgi:sulfur transfer protein SufE
MYDGMTPLEVLDFDSAFLEDLGINAHLTPNRRNGWSQLCKKIADFAKNYI